MNGPYRPLVAVVAYHLGNDRVARWPDGGYGVPAPYIDALRRAGARTALLSPGEPGDPDELLEPFDGLLLVGGGDVDPARYGAEPDTQHNYGVEADRDAFEAALLHEADHLHLPTLCICRGMQVMNVAFGGTLHQHLPNMRDMLEHGVPVENTQTMHEVTPLPRTLLSATTKSGPIACASHHHQGIDLLGEGLVVAGHSPDGLVEAIQRPVPSDIGNVSEAELTWMLGVQWHPEETAAKDPTQQSLFDALSTLARLRGSRARPAESAGRSRAYALAEPGPSWPDRFEREAARIRAALPSELVTQIEHVGSTSVPGLAAKPVIDIQISLHAMAPRAAYFEPLTALGYHWTVDPWDDEHEYFSREGDEGLGFHLHVCLTRSTWERRHLAFRDALRADPETAAAYARLKTDLAAAHPHDIPSYVDGKTGFIRRIEEREIGSGVPAGFAE